MGLCSRCGGGLPNCRVHRWCTECLSEYKRQRFGASAMSQAALDALECYEFSEDAECVAEQKRCGSCKLRSRSQSSTLTAPNLTANAPDAESVQKSTIALGTPNAKERTSLGTSLGTKATLLELRSAQSQGLTTSMSCKIRASLAR